MQKRFGTEEESAGNGIIFAEIVLVVTLVLFIVAMTPIGEMTPAEIWQLVKGWTK